MNTMDIWNRLTRAADDGTGGGGTPATGNEGTAGGVEPPAGTGAAAGDTGSEAGTPAGTPAAPAGSEAPPVKPAALDWREKRIATLTARLREAEARAIPPVPVPGVDPATPAATGLTQADVDRLAGEKAAQIAAQAEFNRQCNEVAVKGQETFGKDPFMARVSALQKLADPQDPASVASYNQFLSAVLETEAPEKVIFDLGADLDEASRLMGLSPVRMATAVAKLAAAKDATVSGAPKPITPIGSRGPSHEDIDPTDADKSDGLDTATWMKRREAQLAKLAAA